MKGTPKGQGGQGQGLGARESGSCEAEQALVQVDRLIICVFLEKDENIYLQRLPHYFPLGRYLWQGQPPSTPPPPHPPPPPPSPGRFSVSSAFQPDGTHRTP